MNIDFDKGKMIALREAVEYYEEHEKEVKEDIKKALKMAKELQAAFDYQTLALELGE